MQPTQNTLIESIGVYLPEESVSTEEVLRGCRTRVQFPLENITGIKTRRVAGKAEFSIDLAKKAIADCLQKSKYAPGDIDLVICCTISRYDEPGLMCFEPSTSSKLRRHFGFDNAISFDAANACAGMFTGIYIVDSLLKSGAVRNGLVVSGEYITHLAVNAQQELENFMDHRLACLTLGDAGAAVILERSADCSSGFQALDLRTLGAYSKYCIAKASDYGGMMMYTDAVNLTNAAIKSGADHSLQTLQKTGWPIGSFEQLIMHQTSGMTMKSAMREINRVMGTTVCHNGNTINNLEHRGNTASTSHFIALADHITNGTIHSGDRVVFSISGSGLTVGTGLYVLDDLPDRARDMELMGTTPQKVILDNKRLPVHRDQPRIRIKSIGTAPVENTQQKSTLQLIRSAAERCLKRSTIESSNIALLIHCGVYRSEFLLEPAYAALVAGELAMNAETTTAHDKQTLAFDIFIGAVGFLNACYVAQQMIGATRCTNAMIVAGEKENNSDTTDPQRLGILETASAMILTSDDGSGSGFSNFWFGFDHLSEDAYKTAFEAGKVGGSLLIHKEPHLESLFLEAMLPAVHELLEMEGIGIDQVDWIFPPQISSDFLALVSEKLNVPPGKIINVVVDGYDLFTSSLPYALDHVFNNGLVQRGEIGLLITVGSGLQVGCAIYHF
jgi:3-oxoacyl-[acyl-carrier-protein] synthase III